MNEKDVAIVALGGALIVSLGVIASKNFKIYELKKALRISRIGISTMTNIVLKAIDHITEIEESSAFTEEMTNEIQFANIIVNQK